MKTSHLQIGQFVTSKKGRDQGHVFIIVDILDERHIAVSDGSMRKLNTPKKKNIRHIIAHDQVDRKLAAKIKGGHAEDSDLRAVIKSQTGRSSI